MMTCRQLNSVLTLLALAVVVVAPAIVASAQETGKAAAPAAPNGQQVVDEPTKTMEESKEPAKPKPKSTAKVGSTEYVNEVGFQEVTAKLPAGTRHEFVMMPLRDGVKLATDVFLPPEGEGPWPAILLRTQYSRWDARPMSVMGDAPCVLVLQNVRGRYGSEGAGTYDPRTFDMDINDSYDAVEWVAAQKWSNGKVGMWGPSGHGIAPCNALWALPPHLTVIDVNVTGDNAYLHWTFLNGARRYEYSWLTQRGLKTKNDEWPRPTTVPFDDQAYYDFIKSKAPDVKTYYRMNAGWFDLFSEAAFDHFAVLAPHGRAYVRVGPTGHGVLGGDLKFKPRNNLPIAAYKSSRGLKECLAGEPDAEAGSCLAYYLMGDAKDSQAPGNIWMTSDKWPVDHTPTSYYMHADGNLSLEAPTDEEAALGYTYDPKDPVKSMGGNYSVSNKDRPIGPLDQRPQADRKDILRFKTAPLTEPVGVTGKIWTELHVSSDCPDTMFVARLVDIYPDGYEAIIREGAMLARYHGGLNKPAALEKGKVYTLSMDMWSTALVFNTGHRIALYVSSSSDPAFEVHPNTYEQVGSIDEARVATNTIHLSADHASKLILPVVPKETYINVGRTP
ncbi:MAG: CocE/NonD family hydrolase [Planctomycetes bacterium]|nr:CocE/NonD family hydrolase [Planctomycetota bacterium]